MKMNMKLSASIEAIGSLLARNGEAADATDQFSCENYDLLAEHQVFSAMVPEQHGGAGVGYREMNELLKQIAGYHPSTALSLSMHQHIIAANVYKDRHGQGGGPLLQQVAEKELRLVSTGFVIAVFSGMADVFGFGNHPFPLVPYFGPWQAIGVMAGQIIILIGFILMVPYPGRKN